MIFSLLVIAATMNVMAINYSAKAVLKLVAPDAQEWIITVAETDFANPAALCAKANTSVEGVAYMYVISGGQNYQTFAANDLADMPLGIMASVAGDYKIVATEVIGDLYLADGANTTKIAVGEMATFTATAGKVINDRFQVVKTPIPTEFKVCHQYGKIIVDNPTTEPMDVVLDGDVIGVAAATRFGSEIEIPATVAAGQHTLEINGQTLIISVQ